MGKFRTQQSISNESEKKIIEALYRRLRLSFGELLQETGLSKPVLNNHLKKLISRKFVKKTYFEPKNAVCYGLTTVSIEDAYIRALTFAEIHTPVTGEYEQEDVKDFLKEFVRRIGLLVTYVLLEGIKIENTKIPLENLPEGVERNIGAEEPYDKADKWVSNAIDMPSMRSQLLRELEKRLDRKTKGIYGKAINSLEDLYPEEISYLKRNKEIIIDEIMKNEA